MKRRTVDDWRRAVYKARVSGNVQVLLLKMADHMRDNRRVSVPRERLADELGIHPQRVAERIKTAVDTGWLSKISGGYRGLTATYEGLFPGDCVPTSSTHSGAERVRPTSTHSTPEIGTHSKRECVPDGGYAITKADLSLPGQARNGGTYEEQAPRPAVCDLTHRWWEREPPTDAEPDPDADRRESA